LPDEATMARRRPVKRQESRKSFDALRERARDPLLTALTIMLAFFMFVLAPLHEAAARDTNVMGLLLALAVAGALLLLTGRAVSAALVVLGIVLAAAAAWLRLRHPSPVDLFLSASAWIIMGLALIWFVGEAVFAPGRITYHRIMGAILLYLAIGLTFVALYVFVGLLAPGAYAGLSVQDSPAFSSTMIYFSFGTLTTAGAGDIAPLHPFARSLTNVEAMIGQLYPATLLARLVTLEIEGEAKR
jgi:hypothetical protein